MHYIYDYLFMSFILLSIIAFCYFTQKQFPSLRNKVFGSIIIIAFFDLILDIFSSIVIEKVQELPHDVTYFVCYAFYTVQIIFPLFLLIYVLLITNNKKWLSFPRFLILLIPFVLSGVLLYSNIFTHNIFYIDDVKGYVHAPYFILLYITTVISIICSFFIIYKSKKLTKQRERVAVYIILLTIVSMVIVQKLMPKYLVTSPSIVLALTIMYMVMQKPENMTDAISGAFNNSALMIFAQSKIDVKKSYSLIIIELMYMRRINRLFGVDFGSKVLRHVADKINEFSRCGWVFRTVGNVFVLVMPNNAESEKSYNKICDFFSSETYVGETSMQLTASVLLLPEIGSALKSVEDLNECLENAINISNRGSHRIISSDLLAFDTRRATIEDSLVHAIKNENAKDHIKVVLQPVYSVKEKKFVSAEALSRYHHDELGDIPPSEFIPIAEKGGLILELDKQIIRKVCQFLKENDTSLTAIEVNLSPMEFTSEHLCERIIQTVKDYGVDPSKIWFEITESGTDVEPKLLNSYMNRLCAEGFKFALDDYGIGYSNISRIMSLPFSVVKIDRSMMLSAMADVRSSEILKSTIQMLHGLNIKVLVEGVETKEQSETMIKYGANYIQGYYYSKPLPIENIQEFIKNYDEKEINE